MPDPEARSPIIEVALAALADQHFFRALLENPDAALQGRSFDFTPAQVHEVVTMVRENTGRFSVDDLMESWRKYHMMGQWHDQGWVGEWRPPFQLPHS